MKRFLLPPDFEVKALNEALGPGRSLTLGPEERLTATYLDTFDWRLHNAGLVLVEERSNRRRLVLVEPDRARFVVPIETTPRTAEDLPPGHLADTAGPLMDVRALVAVGAVTIGRREGRVENTEGDMDARILLERFKVIRKGDEPADRVITTIRVSDPKCLHAHLRSKGVAALTDHDLELVAEANGRSPGDYSSKLRIALEADQPAVSALRTILLDLLDTLETNVSGTVADIDSEFLHDLRVACRRTRSALTQLKGVLPERTVAPFIAEFKWLGSVTSSLRDLDVYLLEMPTYRAVLPNGAGADLDPLVAFIRKERLRARRSVSRALQSRRFRRLRTRWRDTLEGLESPPGRTATRTTADLASPRITKAYLRILKRGTGLGEDPPAEALHRLRIDAKKLRYLLEFFRSLYPRREIAARIRELKRLQDILGGFNDMEVQRDRLSSFARELRTDPAVGTSCILTLGRLAGTLERRQEEYRQAFHDAFTEFSGKPVRSAYSRLFERKGAR